MTFPRVIAALILAVAIGQGAVVLANGPGTLLTRAASEQEHGGEGGGYAEEHEDDEAYEGYEDDD